MKIFGFFSALFLTAAARAHAIVPAGMQTLADRVVDVFTGGLVRAILVICLAGCAVAYAFNKDNEKMKRNVIAIAIAIAVIIGASAIVDVIWSAAGG